VLLAPKPTSSVITISTFGAPVGASARGGNPCLPEGLSVTTTCCDAADATEAEQSRSAIEQENTPRMDVLIPTADAEKGIARLPMELLPSLIQAEIED